MVASARKEREALDWQEWVAGILLPIACILVDYIAGEYVMQFAAAGLVSLAAIGVAALMRSGKLSGGGVGLATIGAIWMCGLAALALGILLAIASCLGLLFSFSMLRFHPLHVPLLLAWSLLGFTPAWTGVVYLKRGYALAKSRSAADRALKTTAFAIAGALMTAVVVVTIHTLEWRWINSQTATLDKATPETWPVTLASLNAYPLCGRIRCRKEVCRQLFRQFAQTPEGGLITTPDAPVQYDAIFKHAYGVSIRDACKLYD